MKYCCVFLLFCWIMPLRLCAQTGSVKGRVHTNGKGIVQATVQLSRLGRGAVTDSNGLYAIKNIPPGEYRLQASCAGYDTYTATIRTGLSETLLPDIQLQPSFASLDEVVVTGTMKEVRRSESAVPVEIFTPKLFQKNPSPSLFESVGMINGVQPQLNCNVCNTGDIHINGMEGPYTMILIDGMPIVSALSTVYGLNGIPNSLVQRIEVVKGPASSLYGSEAMGGIINIITKNPTAAPLFSADVLLTQWGELNADASVKFKAGKATGLLGVNYFNYQQPADKNKDGFTDLTLQHRVSVFNKWTLKRRENRIAAIAARYVYEDRWGGQMQWSQKWRGTDSVYGESIYTSRTELLGTYQLPVKEKIIAQFSYNMHLQDSYYGTTPYMARQQVAFAQLYWDKMLARRHNFLLGASFRYTHYNDNTPATADAAQTPLPGIFVQDEWAMSGKHTLLAGYRYDYDKNHGSVHSPRLAWKFSPKKNTTLRVSGGTGYRVVNLFTEDHAALTGAREVVIAEALKPERSWNSNINLVQKLVTKALRMNIDVTGFYSYFTNRINADFDSDPNKIIYDNLRGYAVSRGVSLNTEMAFNFPLKLLAGISYMDVYQAEAGAPKQQQLHAPRWSGTFTASYALPAKWSLDVTGKWNGPMRLPVLPNDFRPGYSPWFCIVNVQLTKKWGGSWEWYGGVKNLFNFVPRNPIMRPFDPFDKNIADPVSNPQGYTFDPSYNYASLQGIRLFVGVRYSVF
jgi:outer membrane receptor for ferrienterochelin and colicins